MDYTQKSRDALPTVHSPHSANEEAGQSSPSKNLKPQDCNVIDPFSNAASKELLVTREQHPKTLIHNEPYDPWSYFLQTASDAPPPYSIHSQSPLNGLPPPSRFQVQMMLYQQQMDQALQQLRQLGIRQSDRELETLQRSRVARQRAQMGAYKQANTSRRTSNPRFSSNVRQADRSDFDSVKAWARNAP